VSNKYRINKLCPVCGKQFLAKKDCKTRNQVYCSIKCYGKTLKGKKATGKQLECLKLGRVGFPSPFKGETRDKVFCEKISQGKKGVPFSDKHKDSLSKAKKGKPIKHFVDNKEEISRKLSEALKGKPQPNLRGDKHWNWQGGKTSVNAKGRNSLKIKIWKRAVMERDDFTCQMCGLRGGRLQAHHIKAFADHEELRADINNGVTLCVSCHSIVHGRPVGDRQAKNI